MKKHVLILIALANCLAMSAQTGAFAPYGQMYFDLVTRYMIDTSFLYQQVRKGIANNEQCFEQDHYLIYPIYQFDDPKAHTKGDYLEFGFLNTLITLHRMPTENMEGSGWLTQCDKILITDSKGVYMGQADPYSFCSYCKCDRDDIVMINKYAALSEMLFNHTFDFVFTTVAYHPWDDVCIYYGIDKRNKTVSVVFFTKYGIKTMPMDEVVNEHWEDFQQGATELKKEIYNELKQSFDSIMKGVPYDFCYL